jgi:hypothetical protein
MNIGTLEMKYPIHKHDSTWVMDKVYKALLEKGADNVYKSSTEISFSNNFVGNRSNWHIMSTVNSGSFRIIKKRDGKFLIVKYSIKRLLILYAVACGLVAIFSWNYILQLILICGVFSISIWGTLIRYKMFINKIVKSFK